MKIKFACLFILYSSFFLPKGWAQDPEFSQFYAAPLHLNPAMIGFSGEPRFALNYRHQYASFDNLYMTAALSYDQHFERYKSSVGVSLLGDFAGGGVYNTYILSGLYAYNLPLSRNLHLKMGAQVSYLQKSLDYDKLVFGEMINPNTGTVSGVPTEFGGAIPSSAIHRFDIGLGALAYTDKLYIGAAFKHITRPSLSFTDLEDDKNRLGVRSVLHAGYVWYLGPEYRDKPRFYISPNAMFINQDRFSQINLGSYVGKGKFYGGLWLRHAIGNFDALIALVGVKAGIFNIGYSYDFTISGLSTNAGSHELSLSLDFGKSRDAARKKANRDAAKCPEIFSQ